MFEKLLQLADRHICGSVCC